MTELDWKVSKVLRRLKRRRERSTAIRIATTTAAVVLLTGAAVMFTGFAQQPTAGKITVEHVVKPGETLWSIAEAHCGDTYIMQYLHDIKKNNPSVNDGRIYPGQVIRLEYEVRR